MDNRDKVKKLIINFSGKDNVIPIPVIYIKLLGDYHTAAFLNQLVYWSDKTKRTDGYFYKTYKEWHEELRLSRYQIDKSISKLKELGLIETALKKANGAPTLHYKLNTDKLSTRICEKLTNGIAENSQMELRKTRKWNCEKLTNGIAENSQMELRKTDKSLTETTTEITTEITNNNILSGNPTHTPYKEIIDYLNEKTGKRFSHKSKANQKLIRARFNEDNSKEDFFTVIDNMTAQWKGNPKMDEYLRPKTLFSGNFDNYKNQTPKLSGADQLERMKYDPSYWD